MNTRQRMTVDNLLESRGKMSVGEAMRKAGYSPATAKNPQQFTRSKAYEEVLKSIDLGSVLEKVQTTAMDTDDKRAHLQAASLLFQLADKFPAGKLKVQAYNEEVESLKLIANENAPQLLNDGVPEV